MGIEKAAKPLREQLDKFQVPAGVAHREIASSVGSRFCGPTSILTVTDGPVGMHQAERNENHDRRLLSFMQRARFCVFGASTPKESPFLVLIDDYSKSNNPEDHEPTVDAKAAENAARAISRGITGETILDLHTAPCRSISNPQDWKNLFGSSKSKKAMYAVFAELCTWGSIFPIAVWRGFTTSVETSIQFTRPIGRSVARHVIPGRPIFCGGFIASEYEQWLDPEWAQQLLEPAEDAPPLDTGCTDPWRVDLSDQIEQLLRQVDPRQLQRIDEMFLKTCVLGAVADFNMVMEENGETTLRIQVKNSEQPLGEETEDPCPGVSGVHIWDDPDFMDMPFFKQSILKEAEDGSLPGLTLVFSLRGIGTPSSAHHTARMEGRTVTDSASGQAEMQFGWVQHICTVVDVTIFEVCDGLKRSHGLHEISTEADFAASNVAALSALGGEFIAPVLFPPQISPLQAVEFRTGDTDWFLYLLMTSLVLQEMIPDETKRVQLFMTLIPVNKQCNDAWTVNFSKVLAEHPNPASFFIWLLAKNDYGPGFKCVSADRMVSYANRCIGGALTEEDGDDEFPIAHIVRKKETNQALPRFLCDIEVIQSHAKALYAEIHSRGYRNSHMTAQQREQAMEEFYEVCTESDAYHTWADRALHGFNCAVISISNLESLMTDAGTKRKREEAADGAK